MKFTLPLRLRTVLFALVTAASVALAPVSTSFAAAGDLDITFAPGGSASPYAPAGLKRFLSGSSQESGITAAVQLPNGKILTASWCGVPAGGLYDFCINRLLSDGSLDSTFGSSGLASVGTFAGLPLAMAVDVRNDIWVAGTCGFPCIHKFSASGGHYINVGNNGRITVFGMYDFASIAATPDGKIVVGGRCQGTPQPPLPPNTLIYYPCMTRLNADGTTDATFNGGLLRQWGDDPFSGAMLRDGMVNKLSIRPDGRIYASHTCDLGAQSGSTVNRQMCLAIVEPNGTISPIFFGPGDIEYYYVAYFPNTTSRLVTDMAVQPDGSAVLVGSCQPTGGGSVGCSARIIPGVGMDTHFGVNGVLTTSLGLGNTSIGGVLLREDGSLVMSAQCIVTNVSFPHEGLCLAAYTSAGTPLAGFSGGTTSRLIDFETPAAHNLAASTWRGGGAIRVGNGSNAAFLTYGACLTNVPVNTSCIAKVSLAATTGKQCNLDIDGNGTMGGTSDGLLLMRSLFGLSGTAVTARAADPAAPRNSWPAIRDFLGSHCDLPVAP